MEDDVAQVMCDSELAVSTAPDVENETVARDVDGKPVDVVGQLSLLGVLVPLQPGLSVSTLQQLYMYMPHNNIIFMV